MGNERARGRLALAGAGVAALLGLLTFAHFARSLADPEALQTLVGSAWWVVVFVPLAALPIALGTFSFGRAFPRAEGSRRPGFARLFTIRLAGEAINNGLASAYVAGEPVKGLIAARHGATAAAGLGAAVVGKTTFVLGEVLFLFAGAVAAWRVFGTAHPLAGWLAVLAAIGLAVCGVLVAAQLHMPLAAAARALRAARLGPRRLWDRALPGAQAVDGAVRGYWRDQRTDLALSVAWATAGWIAGALELWLFLRFGLGEPRALETALALEAGIAVAKGLSFFVPASIGVQEGGIAALFHAAGLGAEAGVAYALLRRLREVVWIGLGFACLAVHMRETRAPSARGAA